MRQMIASRGSTAMAAVRLAVANRKLLLWTSYDFLRTLVFVLFFYRWYRKAFYQIRGRGVLGSLKQAYAFLQRRGYGIFLRLPGVRTQVDKQVKEATTKIQSQLVSLGSGVNRYAHLPLEGWTREQVHKEMESLSEMKHTRWEDGRVSGAVYHGGKELLDIQLEAFGRFAVANPIHPDVFPGPRKMEAEVVAMVLSMFNAPEGAAGVSTSGGTESILMACLSAREKGRRERGITEPEMIVPETAHAAFRKAGIYFGMKVHLVACPAPQHKVQTSAVRALINPNTVLLVGSAPNFPHGIIDDITALSKLALSNRLPLHVDCCLGSFLVPFLNRAGFETEPFDFHLPGVTSISVDTHKYGFAPKGNSTVLYRTAKLRSYQYYIEPNWSGGVYASPSMAGSRPGALIAGAWASMMSVGEDGYVRACASIVGAAKELERQIQEHPALATDLSVVGRPLVSVVAFQTRPESKIDIYDVADAMSARGWHLNALQSPPAMHVAFTLPIVPVVGQLIGDLKESIQEIKDREEMALVNGEVVKGKGDGSKKKKGDTAALYGVAGALPDKSVVVELAGAFLDTLYLA